MKQVRLPSYTKAMEGILRCAKNGGDDGNRTRVTMGKSWTCTAIAQSENLNTRTRMRNSAYIQRLMFRILRGARKIQSSLNDAVYIPTSMECNDGFS